MQELQQEDLDLVSAGSLYGDIAHAVGYVLGKIGRTSESIDRLENPMLGAMQYGA